MGKELGLEKVSQLTKDNYYSKFDMSKGYWQISVAVDDMP